MDCFAYLMAKCLLVKENMVAGSTFRFCSGNGLLK